MFFFYNTVDRTPLKLGIVSVYCQSKSDFPFSLSLFLKESFEVTSLIADASFSQYCPKQARNGVTEAKLQTNLKSIIYLIFLILCSLCFSCFEHLILLWVWNLANKRKPRNPQFENDAKGMNSISK